MTDILSDSVLVLNQAYLAIQVWTAKDAISALVAGRAEVINKQYRTFSFDQWIQQSLDEDKESYSGIVRSPSVTILVPQVIRVPEYKYCNFAPERVRYSRVNIYRRDSYICQYCRKKTPRSDLTLDHIIPKSRGGKNIWENIVTCCKPCNTMKGDKLLSELGWELKTKPRQPRWKSHVGIPFGAQKKAYWETFLR